jgi:hypothetical protein
MKINYFLPFRCITITDTYLTSMVTVSGIVPGSLCNGNGNGGVTVTQQSRYKNERITVLSRIFRSLSKPKGLFLKPNGKSKVIFCILFFSLDSSFESIHKHPD